MSGEGHRQSLTKQVVRNWLIANYVFRMIPRELAVVVVVVVSGQEQSLGKIPSEEIRSAMQRRELDGEAKPVASLISIFLFLSFPPGRSKTPPRL